MKKLLVLSIYIVSMLILTLPGCSISTMESREQKLNEMVNSIDPFDFGDEFLHDTTRSKDSESTESSSIKVNSNTRIHTDTDTDSSSYKNNQQLRDSMTTPYSDLTVDRFGYRVQIGAFDYKENAEEVKKIARSKTDLPIYVVYIAPFYRVRVGDFTEKSEAEKCVKLLKDKGFSDARWIHTQINAP